MRARAISSIHEKKTHEFLCFLFFLSTFWLTKFNVFTCGVKSAVCLLTTKISGRSPIFIGTQQAVCHFSLLSKSPRKGQCSYFTHDIQYIIWSVCAHASIQLNNSKQQNSHTKKNNQVEKEFQRGS